MHSPINKKYILNSAISSMTFNYSPDDDENGDDDGDDDDDDDVIIHLAAKQIRLERTLASA